MVNKRTHEQVDRDGCYEHVGKKGRIFPLGAFLSNGNRDEGTCTSLEARWWNCIGELNASIANHRDEFDGMTLRTYHSFTKAKLKYIFPRVQSAYPGLDMTTWTLRKLVGNVHQDVPVSISRYEFATPPYLQAWSANYGQGPLWMALFRVEFLESQPEGLPHRTLFLPAA